MTREKMVDAAVRYALPKGFFRVGSRLYAARLADHEIVASISRQEFARIYRRFGELRELFRPL